MMRGNLNLKNLKLFDVIIVVLLASFRQSPFYVTRWGNSFWSNINSLVICYDANDDPRVSDSDLYSCNSKIFGATLFLFSIVASVHIA